MNLSTTCSGTGRSYDHSPIPDTLAYLAISVDNDGWKVALGVSPNPNAEIDGQPVVKRWSLHRFDRRLSSTFGVRRHEPIS